MFGYFYYFQTGSIEIITANNFLGRPNKKNLDVPILQVTHSPFLVIIIYFRLEIIMADNFLGRPKKRNRNVPIEDQKRVISSFPIHFIPIFRASFAETRTFRCPHLIPRNSRFRLFSSAERGNEEGIFGCFDGGMSGEIMDIIGIIAICISRSTRSGPFRPMQVRAFMKRGPQGQAKYGHVIANEPFA